MGWDRLGWGSAGPVTTTIMEGGSTCVGPEIGFDFVYVRVLFRVPVELLPEEAEDALSVAVKVEGRVWVCDGDHLGEVNHRDAVSVVDHRCEKKK